MSNYAMEKPPSATRSCSKPVASCWLLSWWVIVCCIAVKHSLVQAQALNFNEDFSGTRGRKGKLRGESHRQNNGILQNTNRMQQDLAEKHDNQHPNELHQQQQQQQQQRDDDDDEIHRTANKEFLQDLIAQRDRHLEHWQNSASGSSSITSGTSSIRENIDIQHEEFSSSDRKSRSGNAVRSPGYFFSGSRSRYVPRYGRRYEGGDGVYEGVDGHFSSSSDGDSTATDNNYKPKYPSLYKSRCKSNGSKKAMSKLSYKSKSKSKSKKSKSKKYSTRSKGKGTSKSFRYTCDDDELGPVEEIICSANVKDFQSSVVVVFRGVPQFLTGPEQIALENSFQDVYNELTFGNCDGYFRRVESVNLFVPGVQRYGRGYRQLQTSTTDTSSSDDTSFAATGSCRGCPVTNAGKFNLFDDAFRRRRLQPTDSTKENDSIFFPFARKTQEMAICICPDQGGGRQLQLQQDDLEPNAPTEQEFLDAFNDDIERLVEEGVVTSIDSIESLAETPIADEVQVVCSGNIEEFVTSVAVIFAGTQNPSDMDVSILSILFEQVYNELSFEKCDGYFRMTDDTTLKTTGIRNPGTFEVRATCRDCSVDTNGQFNIFSRRRFLADNTRIKNMESSKRLASRNANSRKNVRSLQSMEDVCFCPRTSGNTEALLPRAPSAIEMQNALNQRIVEVQSAGILLSIGRITSLTEGRFDTDQIENPEETEEPEETPEPVPEETEKPEATSEPTQGATMAMTARPEDMSPPPKENEQTIPPENEQTIPPSPPPKTMPPSPEMDPPPPKTMPPSREMDPPPPKTMPPSLEMPPPPKTMDMPPPGRSSGFAAGTTKSPTTVHTPALSKTSKTARATGPSTERSGVGVIQSTEKERLPGDDETYSPTFFPTFMFSQSNEPTGLPETLPPSIPEDEQSQIGIGKVAPRSGESEASSVGIGSVEGRSLAPSIDPQGTGFVESRSPSRVHMLAPSSLSQGGNRQRKLPRIHRGNKKKRPQRRRKLKMEQQK